MIFFSSSKKSRIVLENLTENVRKNWRKSALKCKKVFILCVWGAEEGIYRWPGRWLGVITIGQAPLEKTEDCKMGEVVGDSLAIGGHCRWFGIKYTGCWSRRMRKVVASQRHINMAYSLGASPL